MEKLKLGVFEDNSEKPNKIEEKSINQKITNHDFYYTLNNSNEYLNYDDFNDLLKLDKKVSLRITNFIDLYKKTKDPFYKNQNFGVLQDPSVLGYFGNLPESTETLLDHIDIKNEENFEITEKIFEIIQSELYVLFQDDFNGDYSEDKQIGMFNYSGDSFSPDCFEIVKEKTRKIINTDVDDSSYFLSIYLKDIINTCGNTKNYAKIKEPKKLSNGHYVYISSGEVYISNKEITENEVKKVFDFNKYLKNKKKYYYSNYSVKEIYYKDIKAYLEQNFSKVSIDKEYHNEYVLMMQDDFRNLVEEDLHCDILNFSPLEQFHILKYIKSVKNKEIENLKDFTNQFRETGLKTFLSIEQGGKEMGNKILHLSENLPENEAKEVFAGYSNLIDNANILGEKISSRIGFLNKDKISESVDINKLPNELIDSLMLRAKDVLVGADKVLENQLSGAEEKLNTKDVTDAVLGINTLVSMLSIQTG